MSSKKVATAEQARQTTLKAQQKLISEFCGNILFILTSLKDKNKRDDDIMTLHEQFLIVKREQPLIVMRRSGPYLWKYRVQIEGNKIDELLKNDFEEEIAEVESVAKQHEILPEKSVTEYGPVLLSKIKRTWHLLTDVEKQAIWGRVQQNLAKYAAYIAMERQLAKK